VQKIQGLTQCHVQDNGGRKPRLSLQNAAGDMDIVKVVEWVKNGRLDNIVQANDPTGQAKLRKVCFLVFNEKAYVFHVRIC
jgi:hypothetical protein